MNTDWVRLILCRFYNHTHVHSIHNSVSVTLINFQYLEDQARLCMDLEHECTEIDRHWKERCQIIEKDTEVWRNKFLIEEKKGDR